MNNNETPVAFESIWTIYFEGLNQVSEIFAWNKMDSVLALVYVWMPHLPGTDSDFQKTEPFSSVPTEEWRSIYAFA